MNWSPHLGALRTDNEDLLCWMPVSVRDDGWAECLNQALKELLAEICFNLTSTGTLQGESCALRLPFIVRTENNIHLVEVYRNLIS